MLTCDIETSGLNIESQLLSISFAWDQHEGIAFAIAKKMKEEGNLIHRKGGSDMLSSVIDEAFTNAIKNEISGILAIEFRNILSGKS
jgi:hypothetical protein